jgi:hypothetical protein
MLDHLLNDSQTIRAFRMAVASIVLEAGRMADEERGQGKLADK